MSTLHSIETIRISEPIAYDTMLEQQKTRCKDVEEGNAPNTLFLLEHSPVITMGRNADRAHILHSEGALDRMGVALLATDRGGDVTYHGPGQLVAYPILDLKQWRCSVGWYLRRLETALIQVLAQYGLKGEQVPGYTGVWVDGAKVAAIGVGVHQWVTFHGIALNVSPNMNHFGLIIPCGIADKPVTSLAALLGKAPVMPEVMDHFEKAFRAVFEPAINESE